MAVYAYHHLLEEFQQLSVEDQFRLIQEMLSLMSRKQATSAKQEIPAQQEESGQQKSSDQQETPKRQHSILELRGLGKEVWEGIDVDEYLEQERNSWDG